MTPPKKKSVPKTGKKSRSGTGPSKTGSGKPASRSSAARKKSSAKSNTTGRHIAFAFILGLLLASAFFIFLKPDTPQEPQSVSSVSRTEKGTSSKRSLPKVTEDKAKKTAQATSPKSGASKAQPRVSVGKDSEGPQTGSGKTASEAVAPPVQGQTVPPSPPPSGNEGKNATGTPLGGAPDEGKANGDEKAIESASRAVVGSLIDHTALPYEEPLGANLQDQVRQIDYALIQAARLKKLPAGSMRQVAMEDRTEGKEQYHFQVIEILCGPSADVYVRSVRECLEAWAEKARLVRDGKKNQWSISVNGARTHVLRLYPGLKDFPPLTGTPGAPGTPGTWDEPQPRKGLDKARVRQPGEPALLVIVMDDLGASSKALDSLMRLDFPVTFAFWPHGAHTREGARAAHFAGHEILVHQPMEPLGYPKVKPGPRVLLMGMNDREIRETVRSSLEAVPYAVGLNNHMGSRFTQHRQGVDAVLYVLRERGMFMLDSVTHGRSVFWDRARALGVKNYKRNVFLDVVASRKEILAQLRHAERIALLTGQAVAIGHPLPETLAALQEWQKIRSREVRIVRLRDLQQE
jgi:Uncharacterized protein conserved in bacteria